MHVQVSIRVSSRMAGDIRAYPLQCPYRLLATIVALDKALLLTAIPFRIGRQVTLGFMADVKMRGYCVS